MPPSRKKQQTRKPGTADAAGAGAGLRLGTLLDQLKQLESEKARLLREFEKRWLSRERQERAIRTERARTEKRLHRLEMYLAVLDRAVQRIQRIVTRLKLIQMQQEHLVEEIFGRLERATVVSIAEPRPRVTVPRSRPPAEPPPLRKRGFPALPGLRPSGRTVALLEMDVDGVPEESMEAEAETLSAREASEAKAALLSILDDIQSFRQKREEIQKEVDRLRHI